MNQPDTPTPDDIRSLVRPDHVHRRAYADAGMRAVLAPMVAEFSFYEAIPGLMDALPPALQKEVERLRLAPGICRNWRRHAGNTRAKPADTEMAARHLGTCFCHGLG